MPESLGPDDLRSFQEVIVCAEMGVVPRGSNFALAIGFLVEVRIV